MLPDWKLELVRESIKEEIWNGEHEEQTEENGLSFAERKAKQRAAMWSKLKERDAARRKANRVEHDEVTFKRL